MEQNNNNSENLSADSFNVSSSFFSIGDATLVLNVDVKQTVQAVSSSSQKHVIIALDNSGSMSYVKRWTRAHVRAHARAPPFLWSLLYLSPNTSRVIRAFYVHSHAHAQAHLGIYSLAHSRTPYSDSMANAIEGVKFFIEQLRTKCGISNITLVCCLLPPSSLLSCSSLHSPLSPLLLLSLKTRFLRRLNTIAGVLLLIFLKCQQKKLIKN